MSGELETGSKSEAWTPPVGGSPTRPRDKEEYRLHRRFDRVGRLVGDAGMHRLLESHVMVIGNGNRRAIPGDLAEFTAEDKPFR